MKKSVAKNKKNRKLRKAMRRTFGALFMISAIIIAAIPFPEAMAEGEDGTYAYAVTASDYLSGTNYPNLNYINSVTYASDDAKAYTVRSMSSNTWQLDWQFQFKVPSGQTNGVITKYNDDYAAETVEISYKVRTKYFTVTQEEYDDFFSNDTFSMTDTITGDTLSLSRAGTSVYTIATPDDPDKWFFEKYYSTLYTTYVTDYNKYKASLDAHDLWALNGDDSKEEPTLLPKPDDLSKTPAELSDADKLTFFCDIAIGKGYGFTLTKVDNATNSGIVPVYLAKGSAAPVANTNYEIDSNGFLCGASSTIDGIAKEAFKEIHNVVNLTLASEICNIGDSAFENSFVSKVVLIGATGLGNAAFKNCKKLTSISLPESVTYIGAEAFYGSALTDVTIPYSVNEIGAGAFANCINLKTVSNAGTTSMPRVFEKYSFFNCTALDSIDFGQVVISNIGEGAFAVDQGVTGNLTEFHFPNTSGSIENSDDLGDYILAGRANLKKIVMPANFGRNQEAVIKDHMFLGCINLQCFEFPDDGNGSCGYAKYSNTLFSTVINEQFYVKGPKVNKEGKTASPRKSTWGATYMNSTDKHVPYVYTENGENFYEVSDGTYVMVIDNAGLLTSCNFAITAADIETLTIPKNVGTTLVTGIKEGSFISGSDGVLDHIKNLVIEDGSLTSIGDNAFYSAQKLVNVTLGNSVAKIGNSAFGNCPELISVKIGSGITSIGENAFKSSSKLTDISFASPAAGTDSFPMSSIGTEAFSTGGEKLTITGEISPNYGPFAWAMQTDNYMNVSQGVRVCYKTPEPSNLTVILDNQNNLPTLVDYPHYGDLSEDIRSRYESNGTLTPAEESLVKATLSINVPKGVKSIDSKGYFNNSSKQIEGVEPFSNINSALAYSLPTKATYKGQGLFNGELDEYTGVSSYEKIDLGNDRMQSINLNSVLYLPDGCFYSCEALETVNLGSDITDVGLLPFENCTSLTSVASGNDKFVANNGVLYENLSDSSKRLVECFASRGTKVGSSTISVKNDPDLANVSEIAVGAFRNCDTITSADFTGANKFDEIPNECFANSDLLTEVDLPANVTIIGDSAFSGTGAYTKVFVRGKEVSLGKDAFKDVSQSYLVSYEGSGVQKAADKQGVNVEQTLDDMYTVKFYTYDGNTLIQSVQVEEGGTAEAPDDDKIPVRIGYTFKGWNKSLKNVTEDMFVLAVYTENASTTPGTTPGVTPSVTSATATTTPKTTSTVTPSATATVSPTSSATQYQLTVVYGSGSGKYASGTTVIINAIEPPAGKVFDKWVTTTTGLTIASATSMATTVKTTNSDATITATYKNSGSVSANSTKSSSLGGAIETRDTSNSGTTVDITKPGISNTDKAYASVSGSSDSFIVKISESDDAANQVATALSNEYSDMNPIKYFAMDISLYDATGTTKVENNDGLSVNITMPIPDALTQYAGNNKVGAVINGSLNVLNCKFLTIDGIPCISFTASHFSPYTIFVDTANLTQGTLDSTPKTGDGIHPKWFVVIALACISLILFMKKDYITKVEII